MLITNQPQGELPQEAINGRLYQRANLVRTYSTTKLYPAEAAALIRYQQDVVGKRVLDLGCGAGRLATYLWPLTDDYVGTDISHYMIDHCRRTFEGLQFIQGDMRNLAGFESESIDTAIAISNLFDAVSHEERLGVLAEVRRVLKPGGLLIFSSHNRNYAHIGAAPKLQFHRNPFTMARMFMSYLQATANHRRIKRLQRFEPEYALVNDSGNNYASLHYYVTRDVQARQLASVGFQLIECLDEQGFTISPADDDGANASIQYLARRAP